MQQERGLLAGIDIGGTKIGVCVGTHEGVVTAGERWDTDPDEAPEDVLRTALARVRALASGGRVAAIGASCPGPFVIPEGRFLDPPNMPAWHGFPLLGFLRSVSGVPAAAMNDANALALAEWRWGAGRGTASLVFFTMSTGMGAGLVLDGRLYEGRRGFAGEVGHWRLAREGPVGFGKRGSVEGFLSGPGIVQVAREEACICAQTGESTRLLASGTDAITTEDVCSASRAGDAAARRVTDRCARRLGELMALLVDLLEPELFVLGTIGGAHLELFVPGAREVLAEEALAHALDGLRIEASAFDQPGNQSALAVARRALVS